MGGPVSCDGPRCCWRRSGVSFRGDRLGDDQPPPAARAWHREDAGGRIGFVDRVIAGETRNRRFGPEQVPDPGDIGGTVAISEEAVVADAVLALWQDMDEEPADELFCLEGHGFVPAGTVDAVVLDAEGDAALIHADQAAVGDRDAVRVARQVGQHRLGPGKRFFGIHDPVDLAQRLQESVKGSGISQY